MHSPETVRKLLCALGDHLREIVIESWGTDMSSIAGVTSADTIYEIDRITDDALVTWFEQFWPDVVLVSEGLEHPVAIGREPAWAVIVDTVDGTRGLMYGKRPAWSLAAAAPIGGSLEDVVAAAMTELPTPKQAFGDQLSAGPSGPILAHRVNLQNQEVTPLKERPSTASDLEHGFAGLVKFFPAGKVELAAIESELFVRLGSHTVFDDQYISSGGQLYELITGRTRFVADLRPLVAPDSLACHPYDICTAMLLERAGGVVTDPWGAPLRIPLDTTTPVGWVGYANRILAETIAPELAGVLRDRLGR